MLVPNIITLLALCSGVTAIRLGLEGRFELAVAAVILAIMLDAVDGRLARFLNGTSRFGAELDSLADFVNFGVAPALIQTAEMDVLRDEGEAFARKLDRAGVDVTATRYNGLIHDYGLLNPISRVPGVRSALLHAAAELKKRLS